MRLFYLQYDWDLAINWVVMHIDGVANARQISKKSEVDMEMVRACLRVLKHHGVIALVDMFFYTNRYEFTERATAMLAGKEQGKGAAKDKSYDTVSYIRFMNRTQIFYSKQLSISLKFLLTVADTLRSPCQIIPASLRVCPGPRSRQDRRSHRSHRHLTTCQGREFGQGRPVTLKFEGVMICSDPPLQSFIVRAPGMSHLLTCG